MAASKGGDFAPGRGKNSCLVVVAVPVAVLESCQSIGDIADEVVCAFAPEPFTAVGLWYLDYPRMTDFDVRQLLKTRGNDGRVARAR